MNQPNNDYCSSNSCNPTTLTSAEELNLRCFCKTLNNEHLDRELQAEGVDRSVDAFFSSTASFLSRKDFAAIQQTIAAVERVVGTSDYQVLALSNAHPNAKANFGLRGAFMGYDFHLSDRRPQLIEINTNAGGAFLNASLLDAQKACCPPMEQPLSLDKKALYQEFVQMFMREWQLQRGDQPLQRVAIVDRDPTAQFLFPEFQIAKRLFESQGIAAVIVDPEELVFEQQKLLYNGQVVDLVYNRLTDFTLSEPASDVLNRAYQAGAVVVTPNPFLHALYADKYNLTQLSDAAALASLGASTDDITTLTSSIPKTVAVTKENADVLWQQRRQWFFKPISGFGSKATYRGDKLTKRVWEEILQSQYVAQAQVPPSERGILLDGVPSSLKMDVRAYVYEGNIQLLAARLYQGQTTNFRTAGGGFSPVYIY